MQHYDVLPQMRKSLAKSAREAADAIAAHEAAERKKRTEGGAGSWLREADRASAGVLPSNCGAGNLLWSR